MYADVNRKNLDPEKNHFISQVLHHQGRVLLPSDLNEHGAIFQYYLRQFIIDFVGRYWRAGTNSFTVSDIDLKESNFKIVNGHFYADGILCVNGVDCWYSPKDKDTNQPKWPTPEWDDKQFPQHFAVYLECWERHVNPIQRPVITEVALGIPDTSSRLEIAWQVRVLTPKLADDYVKKITSALSKILSQNNDEITKIEGKNTAFQGGINCQNTQDLIDVLDAADPKLRVWAKKLADATEPCSISPDSQYRGLENQLYRVEIHTPGVSDQAPKPSFKWSRENGSITFKIISESLKPNSGEITLDVEKLGPDRRYGLCVNDWVELTSDEIEFGQKVLPLAKVKKIQSNLGRLTLSMLDKSDLDGCTMLRRWDQNPNNNTINNNGTIDIVEGSDDVYDKGNWILLEQGIKIQFQPGGNYRKGDYWLIPARVATGDVVWPKKKDTNIPDARPTDGVKRHRAALGVVINGTVVGTSCSCTVVPDCEKKT